MSEERQAWTIREDDLSGQATRALIAMHQAGMQAHSPPQYNYALDLCGLQGPDVKLWSAWRGERLAGIVALRQLSARQGELKSMRTHPDFLRQGAASALLEHVIAQARRRGLTRLSLETGAGAAFEPGLALYRRHGFVVGAPFGDYQPSGSNQFFHLGL